MRGLRCLAGLVGACLALGLPEAMAVPPAWLPGADVSPLNGDATDPHIAFDPTGNATAVWSHTDAAQHLIVQAAELPAGSDVWQPPNDLSAPGQDAVGARIAVDAAGDALAVWDRYDRISSDIIEASWRSAATGVWQAPVDLSPAGVMAQEPKVAFDAQGNAVVAWLAFPSVIRAAVRSAASGPGKRRSTSPPWAPSWRNRRSPSTRRAMRS
jgi:hypothetical protein